MTRFRAIALASFAMLLTTVSAWTAEKPENKLSADVQTILEKAEQFELLSLDPAVEGVKGKEGFHGWKILGKTMVKDAAVRKEIVTALDKGIAESDGNGAKCFDPRHGIRAQRDGKTVELVICFECMQVQGYLDKSEKSDVHFLVTKTPQDAFDKVLKAAGVKLAPKSDKK